MDAVLVDRQPTVPGTGPQADVVLLRTGEILERGAKRGSFDYPQVDLHVARPTNARLCVAPLQDGTALGPLPEVVHHGRRIIALDDEVEIPNRLPATPPAARGFDLPGAGALSHPADQIRRNDVGLVPQEPRMLGILRERDVLQDGRLRLGTKPLHVLHASVPACSLERVERIDPQFVDEHPDLLGSEPRHPHQFEDDRRHLLLQVGEERKTAGIEQGFDFCREIGTDSL